MSSITVGQTHVLPRVGPKRVRSWLLWFGIVVVAAFCVHRLYVFRPGPLDSPGSLRPALYRIWDWWLHLSGTPDHMIAMWDRLCFIALCIPPALAFLHYLWRVEALPFPRQAARFVLSRSLFFCSIAAGIVLCRFPVLLFPEMNPDAGQFLYGAHKLFWDHNFFHAVDVHTSGPLNVYPLMLPAIFGASPDFASSRTIGLIVIFLSTYVLYRAYCLVMPDAIARIAALPIPAAFCVFKSTELTHMSSEHIPLLEVSIAVYLSMRVLSNPRKHRTPLFLLGLTASAGFFTKMQSVPVILASAAVAVLYVHASREARQLWKPTWFVAAGALSVLVLNAILCIAGGSWNDFWNGYVLSNWRYPGTPGLLRITVPDFVQLVFRLEEIRFLIFTSISIGAAFLLQRYLRRTNEFTTFVLLFVAGAETFAAAIYLRDNLAPSYWDLLVGVVPVLIFCAVWLRPAFLRNVFDPSDRIRWFGFVALASIASGFAAAYLPRRGFWHYLLFTVLPVCMGMAWMLARQYMPAPTESGNARPARRMIAFVSVFVSLVLAYELYGWSLPLKPAFGDTHADLVRAIGPAIRPPEGEFIRSLTTPHDQIRVWGWTVRPYLASGREGEGKDTDVLYLFRKDRLGDYYRQRFISDMRQQPPVLFIDATGPTSWFLNDRAAYKFENVPEVAAFVNANYEFVGDGYAQRYFLRRDLAGRLNAVLGAPLPAKTCDPRALSCLSTPIILPTALPAVRIPEHALVQAEFMGSEPQTGPATVLNNEAIPNSHRGLRFFRIDGDRYILLVGTGDKYVGSKEFTIRPRQPVWLNIEFNRELVSISCNSDRDEMHLPKRMADGGGAIDLDFWLWDADPFIGKMQFFQIVDLERAAETAR